MLLDAFAACATDEPRLMDIFVLTSRFEALPNALMEARLAAGKRTAGR